MVSERPNFSLSIFLHRSVQWSSSGNEVRRSAVRELQWSRSLKGDRLRIVDGTTTDAIPEGKEALIEKNGPTPALKTAEVTAIKEKSEKEAGIAQIREKSETVIQMEVRGIEIETDLIARDQETSRFTQWRLPKSTIETTAVGKRTVPTTGPLHRKFLLSLFVSQRTSQILTENLSRLRTAFSFLLISSVYMSSCASFLRYTLQIRNQTKAF